MAVEAGAEHPSSDSHYKDLNASMQGSLKIIEKRNDTTSNICSALLVKTDPNTQGTVKFTPEVMVSSNYLFDLRSD